MNFIKYLRCCAVCGCFSPPTEWLCSYCLVFLEKQFLYYTKTYRVQKTLPHLRLFDWDENNHFFMTKFIQSLKGGGQHGIFKQLALEAFCRFSQAKCWPKQNLTFVAAAPEYPERKDHAYMFAKYLSEFFKGELLTVLKRESLSSQKVKTKSERSKIRFSLTKPINRDNIVFVDDVLTTGSTAQNSFKILQPRKSFIICTLAYKVPPENLPELDFLKKIKHQTHYWIERQAQKHFDHL